MKKIDKLIIRSFIGPFILTFFVVVFILLTIHISKYFEDLVGKDLGWDVLSELLVYFAVFNTPVAFPLAVLLSSLMTFGNLGEHSEIIALKSAGISLTRAMMPIFILVLGITGLAFYTNNYKVPQAALNAYSLIYDIKQKKPALDIKAGTFYNGIPNYSIKVSEKMEDGRTLKDLIIYNHSEGLGNKEVILADSGLMYTILNDRYLKFELYRGTRYLEMSNSNRGQTALVDQFTRTFYDRMEIVLDLSSFDLKRHDKDLFSGDRLTRNFTQLSSDIDSLRQDIGKINYDVFRSTKGYFAHHLKDTEGVPLPENLVKYKREMDSLERISGNSPEETHVPERPDVKMLTLPPGKLVPTNQEEKTSTDDALLPLQPARQSLTEKQAAALREYFSEKDKQSLSYNFALNSARQIKSRLTSQNSSLDYQKFQLRKFEIQYNKMLAHSFACIVMFLIGAPLGAIIKRGGLGAPVLFSILFFILFYVIYITGENWAKENAVHIIPAIWMADVLLLPIGLFFLRQARRDARLFDADYYRVMLTRFIKRTANSDESAQIKPEAFVK
ncbi:MAG TPA: LptF/LptG family permease [Cyclobacteriaceae bacterium]|jgi:lipopolysaccharide export system permease protein